MCIYIIGYNGTNHIERYKGLFFVVFVVVVIARIIYYLKLNLKHKLWNTNNAGVCVHFAGRDKEMIFLRDCISLCGVM